MVLDESTDIEKLNETIVKIIPSVSEKILNSSYYPRIKVLELPEIIRFCKEQTSLKNDLLAILTYVGEQMSEEDIRNIFDSMKRKYNQNDKIGLDYHIEMTRYDYGICLFVIIKRDDVYAKKFVFRYKRKDKSETNIDGLTSVGYPLSQQNIQDIRRDNVKQILKSLGKEDSEKYGVVI